MVFGISLTLPVNIFRTVKTYNHQQLLYEILKIECLGYLSHLQEFQPGRHTFWKIFFCPNYSRSYNVHKQVEKYFTVPKNNKHDMVATDWLKPVYVDQQQNFVQQTTTNETPC